MMDVAATLIEELKRHQVELALDGDRLEVEWPIDEVDPALVDRLQQNEAALVAYLRALAASEATSAPTPDAPVLSFAQQRLWFIDRLEQGSTQYNQPVALRLDGELDAAALQRAFDTLLARHETLRTTVALHDGKPVPCVLPATGLPIERVDLRALSADAQAHAVEAAIAAEAATAFDLAADLMLRARLLQCDARHHVLLVTLHHIASDGWSIGVFVREFSALYAAFSAGQPDPLPPLSTRYPDYARWQRERLQGDRLQQQAGYWRTQLAGAPAVHGLPLDRARPAQQSFEADVHVREIPAALQHRLQALAQAQRSTLFMVLQCAFATLVHRRSGQDDVVLGVPVAGRTHVELEPLVGLFVNTLVLRTRVQSQMSFADLLALGRDTMLAAFEHQDIPFDMLVEQLRPERSRSHAPVFQLMFSLQEQHTRRIALPGLEIQLLDSAFRRVKCDLELEIAQREDGLAMHWRYASSLFDRATIERMGEHLLLLLEAIADAPTRPLAQLPALPPAEADRIAQWNATHVDFPADDTLVGMFERRAASDPHRVALVVGEREWTYAQLDARAKRLAHELIHVHGVAPGVMVGHCLERSLALVVAMLAIMKAGAAYVALDPGQPAQRLAHMLADSGAPLVVTQAHLASNLGGEHAARVLLLDEEAADRTDPAGTAPLATRARANGPAYVIYTSGSTGLPKGTLNLHRGPCNRVHALQQQFALGPDDRVLQKTPLSFDVSVWELFWPLSVGAAVILAAPQGHKDPLYLARLLAAQRISVVHFVPSMLQMFLRSAAPRALAALRFVMTSGEALSFELQQQSIAAFPGVRLINHYGPTETGIEVTWWPFDAPRADRVVPIGRPIANCRIHVLDIHGLCAPIGVPGELHIGGVQVGEGYLNNPTLTAERFVTLAPAGAPERLYRTGDLVRWLDDGQIEYLGRLDNQVKLRGMRVELGEIESRVRAFDAVEEAVVVVDGELASQRLLCYLVPRPQAAADAASLVADLRRFLGQSLPAYMLECRYIVLDSLPLSPNGKIDRLALPRPAADDAPVCDRVAPSGSTERALAAIWAAHLGLQIERVGVTDSFFEVGGNSLLTIAVQADILRELQIEVAVADLFRYPTIQHLARHIDGASDHHADRSHALKSARDRVLRARSRHRSHG